MRSILCRASKGRNQDRDGAFQLYPFLLLSNAMEAILSPPLLCPVRDGVFLTSHLLAARFEHDVAVSGDGFAALFSLVRFHVQVKRMKDRDVRGMA